MIDVGLVKLRKMSKRIVPGDNDLLGVITTPEFRSLKEGDIPKARVLYNQVRIFVM